VFARYSLRLRPSVGSLSLVSFAASASQLGWSGIKSAARLERLLVQLQSGEIQLEQPGRKTPEKSLQSWLIRQAAGQHAKISAIGAALNDGHSYWFLSDEIALTDPESNERIVADLLLMRESPAGEVDLVNVELKSKRTTDTFKQVVAFRRNIESAGLQELWREFAELMRGGGKRRWKSMREVTGIVVWPSSSETGNVRSATATLVAGCREQGVQTLCYSEPHYQLKPEFHKI
jgi:hypothetical protein